MRPLTVAVLGDPEWAKALGKVHTTSDVALGSFREGDALVTLVLPLRYPEKPQALAYAVNSADGIVLAVDKLGKELGESILAADAAGATQGLVVLRNNLQPEQLAPLLRNTTLAQWPVLSDDKHPAARQRIAAFASRARAEGPVRVPVDHHFDVKGVGTVALGFVTQGISRKHDTYRAYPTEQTCQVRSIQVHDEDVAQAQPGDHVGFALKGIANEQLDRGHILAPAGSMDARAGGANVRLLVKVSPFCKQGLQPGKVLHFALGWQFVPLRVASGSLAAGQAGTLEAQLEKPLAFEKGQTGVLFDLDAPQRVAGRAVVEG